jgi:hypothetical protein
MCAVMGPVGIAVQGGYNFIQTDHALNVGITYRRSDESRTTTALPLSCQNIVDDVTRTEYGIPRIARLIILSHIVLAKFAITLREIF